MSLNPEITFAVVIYLRFYNVVSGPINKEISISSVFLETPDTVETFLIYSWRKMKKL